MQRLSPGVLILGVFAILFGLVAAYGVKKYLSQEPVEVAAPEPPKVEPIQVPVALVNLPAGRTMMESDVTVLMMTKEEVAKAKLPRIFFAKVPQIVGRTLREAVKAGQAFEPSVFYPEGTGPDVTESLKPGERAVTIPFQNDTVDSTFVRPGTVVDVLFRTSPDLRGDVPDATVTLLSRVRVLAVAEQTLPGSVPKQDNQDAGARAVRNQTVTLAVNQTQARALKVADGRGIFTLALRNPKDETVADTGGPTTLPGLLGMKEPQRPFVSEQYRRGQHYTMWFGEGLRQKIKLDPPYGLPVERKAKDGKDGKDGKDEKDQPEQLEVWPTGYWGWGGNYGHNSLPTRGSYWGY